MRLEKRDVESGFPSKNITEIAPEFSKMVGGKFRRCKEVGLTYLQAEVTVGGSASRLRDPARTTKKETVILPRFRGD